MRLVVIMTINGELRVEQHAGIVATQFYHILQHREKIPFVVFLVLGVSVLWTGTFRAVLCLLLGLCTGIWYRSLTLVKYVEAPDSFQEAKEDSVLEFILQFREGEYRARIIERVGT